MAFLAVAAAGLAGLAFTTQPAWPWRAVAGGLAMALAWAPVRRVIFGRGCRAVRRVEWTPEGEWRLLDRGGRTHHPMFCAASGTFGPWLLLTWHTTGRVHFHALIDAACTDPRAYRTLKGRLNC